MTSIATDIIETIRALDDEITPEDARRALEDGAFLAEYDWSQEEVESAYDLIYGIESWDEIETSHN